MAARSSMLLCGQVAALVGTRAMIPVKPLAAPPALELEASVVSALEQAAQSAAGGSQLRTADQAHKVNSTRVNRTAANSTAGGEIRPRGWAQPDWYSDVPELHRQLNDNTGLHDVYELGVMRTTPSPWSLKRQRGETDWMALINPKDLTWNHVIQKLDELRGYSVPHEQYANENTLQEEVAEDPWSFDYSDDEDVQSRPPEKTWKPPPRTKKTGSTHKRIPPTRDRSNPGDIEAEDLNTNEQEPTTTDTLTAGPDAFDMLDDLIRRTHVSAVARGIQRRKTTTTPAPFSGWGGQWKKKLTTVTTPPPTTPPPEVETTTEAPHHLHIPATHEPVTLAPLVTTAPPNVNAGASAPAMQGLEAVLYLLDKLVARTSR